jgi:hypothetical protein
MTEPANVDVLAMAAILMLFKMLLLRIAKAKGRR